jgi:hypothetical protein
MSRLTRVRLAIIINGDLCDDCDAEELTFYIPRIPINVAEARLMLAMFNPANDGKWYAGHTNSELEAVGGASISRQQRLS